MQIHIFKFHISSQVHPSQKKKKSKGEHDGRTAWEIQFNLENEFLKEINKNKKLQDLWPSM